MIATDETIPITFVEHHVPPLADGDYTVEMTQTIDPSGAPAIGDTQRATAGKKTKNPLINSKKQKFTVAGPRFSLAPSDISGVYPPNNSDGDYAWTLPHVSITRSTLPWERSASKSPPKKTPWLALILFDGEEAPKSKVVDINIADDTVYFPSLESEYHDDPERATIIDVLPELLKKIAPLKSDLSLLCHVRTMEPQGMTRAVVLANRTSERGKTAVMHLVSLEGHFTKSVNNQMDGLNGQTKPVRLVSLKSWRYQCRDEKEFRLTSKALAQHSASKKLKNLLNKPFFGEERFKTALSNAGVTSDKLPLYMNAAAEHKVSFKNLLLDLSQDMLRMPVAKSNDRVARTMLNEGFTPLPHLLRTGSRTVSWYRSPLTPSRLATVAESPTALLPVASSDTLLTHNTKTSPPMLDTSYAAAWELGRLLTLQSRTVSLSLFNWKRRHVQAARELKNKSAHLAFHDALNLPELPPEIASWFHDLALLKGVPFHYLVPYETMLPREAIRFFSIDKFWVDVLLDGAHSIGRTNTADVSEDHALYKKIGMPSEMAKHPNDSEPLDKNGISGLLIRSDVVAGWPDLLIKGFDSAGDSAKLYRMERLSANVLIVLFQGQLDSVDISQHPQGLHSGLSAPDVRHKKAYKSVRYISQLNVRQIGKESRKIIYPKIENNRKIDTVSLSKQFTDSLNYKRRLNSAELALQLIEGVEKVRFELGK